MAKRFELIVFDWDGTLLDSTAAIATSVQAAARDLDLPVPSDERARHIIGLGLIDAMRYALPDLPEHRYREVANRYRHHYLSRDHELELFAGAVELIESLASAGHQLAVATGKSRQGLDRAFAASGLGPLFVASRTADECHSKPHPQMLLELMDELRIAPEATLMIGDTTHDLQMAQNAEVACLGVSYGAHPREALVDLAPVFCADDVGQMTAWLRENA
jgi:phosphoglycolate phosphatase